MVKFVNGIFAAYDGTDASLIEINPVFKTSDNKILAADAKVIIDNNALFRHPDISAMRDFDEEDPIEVEATRNDLNYVKLTGERRLYGKWGRTCHGNHGYHKAFRWRSCKFP